METCLDFFRPLIRVITQTKRKQNLLCPSCAVPFAAERVALLVFNKANLDISWLVQDPAYSKG